MSAEHLEPESEILASRMGLGTIKRCPDGLIHFAMGTTDFRLSEPQFWTLLDMFYESARRIVSRPVKRKSKRLA